MFAGPRSYETSRRCPSFWLSWAAHPPNRIDFCEIEAVAGAHILAAALWLGKVGGTRDVSKLTCEPEKTAILR